MLRGVLPGAFVLIFLLCLTSFTVALAVGGGPKGTTIELAIYQAFRFEFNLGKAASLATIQFWTLWNSGTSSVSSTIAQGRGYCDLIGWHINLGPESIVDWI